MCQTSEVIWHYEKVNKRDWGKAMERWGEMVKLMALYQVKDVNTMKK